MRSEFGATSLETYVAAVIRESTTPNGVFGSKLLWPHLREGLLPHVGEIPALADRPVSEVLDVFFPGLHYIFLRRLDHTRQAVSWVKAMRTRTWRRSADASEMRQPGVVFDFAAIDARVQLIAEEEENWRSFFAGADVHPLQVIYEDLSAFPEREVRRVLDYLSIAVPGDYVFTPPLGKMADETTEEWIHLYDAHRTGAHVVYTVD